VVTGDSPVLLAKSQKCQKLVLSTTACCYRSGGRALGCFVELPKALVLVLISGTSTSTGTAVLTFGVYLPTNNRVYTQRYSGTMVLVLVLWSNCVWIRQLVLLRTKRKAAEAAMSSSMLAAAGNQNKHDDQERAPVVQYPRSTTGTSTTYY
jgi:hypothetical protein